jgi:hypothetical protein
LLWWCIYPQGRDPESTPSSLQGCPPPACTTGRTSLRICGTWRHSPSSRVPFVEYGSPSHWLSLCSHWERCACPVCSQKLSAVEGAAGEST